MAVIGTSNIIAPHRLSIRLRADGFSFLTLTVPTGEVWRSEDFCLREGEPLVDTLAKALDNINPRDYESVETVLNTPSTRIPLEEFRRDELATLYRVVFPRFDMRRMDICYTILPSLELAEIFAVAQDVRRLLSARFPLGEYRNVQGQALERMAHHHRRVAQQPRALYAHIEDHTLFLVAFDGETLTFANTFEARRPADTLYFTLYTYQTLALDALSDPLILSGEEVPTEVLRSEARKYIKRVMSFDV